MRALLVAAITAGIVTVTNAPAAHAEVSAACWAHLAGKSTHVTPAADRRYHLERGEESPCSEADAGWSTASSDSGHRHDDEGKSRYCRKRWWC